MPLLYENVFRPRPPAKGFAQVKDTERTLTVTLAAGHGTILDAWAYDQALNKITKAYPGQGIGLDVEYKNIGDTDTIWCTIKDKDTGVILVRLDGLPCSNMSVVNAGVTVTWAATPFGGPGGNVPTFLMPNKTLNLLIESGHGA